MATDGPTRGAGATPPATECAAAETERTLTVTWFGYLRAPWRHLANVEAATLRHELALREIQARHDRQARMVHEIRTVLGRYAAEVAALRDEVAELRDRP